MNPVFGEPLLRVFAAQDVSALASLRRARVLVTGATGFFGNWVLRTIQLLNTRGFGIEAQCVSRSPEAFLRQHPDIAKAGGIDWLAADVRQLDELAVNTHTTHILHMAASSDARDYAQDPMRAATSILDGTRQCIGLATKTGAHLHFVSSGAVYGPRLASQGPAQEGDAAAAGPDPLDPRQAYANAKRMSEALLACGLDNFSISRPFAFLGPQLPLDQHFAAGNFVADAAAGRAIVVQGDGTPLRSYMHPADLAFWLLRLLAKAGSRDVVNVGSDVPLSIAALAQRISQIARSPAPHIMKQPGAEDAPAYWPDVSRANSLGLTLTQTLDDCIGDCLAWAQASKQPVLLS